MSTTWYIEYNKNKYEKIINKISKLKYVSISDTGEFKIKLHKNEGCSFLFIEKDGKAYFTRYFPTGVGNYNEGFRIIFDIIQPTIFISEHEEQAEYYEKMKKGLV